MGKGEKEVRKAVIREADGFVENVIEIEEESTWQPPENCYLIDADGGSPGDTWDGEKFVKPEPEPEPQPPRDPLAEIDKINAKIADYDTLKAKVAALEAKVAPK